MVLDRAHEHVRALRADNRLRRDRPVRVGRADFQGLARRHRSCGGAIAQLHVRAPRESLRARGLVQGRRKVPVQLVQDKTVRNLGYVDRAADTAFRQTGHAGACDRRHVARLMVFPALLQTGADRVEGFAGSGERRHAELPIAQACRVRKPCQDNARPAQPTVAPGASGARQPRGREPVSGRAVRESRLNRPRHRPESRRLDSQPVKSNGTSCKTPIAVIPPASHLHLTRDTVVGAIRTSCDTPTPPSCMR